MPQDINGFTVHETDVLVLGAAAAGTGAALAALEAGRRVLLVDKGKFESCGSIGGGNDHFMAVLNTDEPFDTTEDFIRFYEKPNWGLVPATIRQWAETCPHMIKFLESVGVEFRHNADGSYMRSQGFGQPGSWWILIKDGEKLKPRMSRRILEMGAECLNHVQVTRLIAQKGRIVGAVGFDVRTGEFHVMLGKAVILCLGPVAERGWTNSTGNPFNCMYPPSVTGSHFVLPYEMGAELACLDNLQGATLFPKSFGCPGMNGITGSGAHGLNARGERYMLNYHAMTEQAPRGLLMQGTVREQLKQAGPPFYMDMRHIDSATRDILDNDLMPGDKATWHEYCEQKGFDIATSPMEIEIGSISMEGRVLRNKNFQSTLPGLYVGCSFMSFSGAICGGYLAAKHASEEISSATVEFLPLDEQELNDEKDRVLKPLLDGGDTTYQLFESAIHQVMNYYMGYTRNEKGMRQALASLERIEKLSDDLRAENLHELMRIHECLDLMKLCKLVVTASIERRETSLSTMAIRGDYPEPDKNLADKILVIRKKDGAPELHWEIKSEYLR